MGSKRDREWKSDKQYLKDVKKDPGDICSANDKLDKQEFHSVVMWMYQWARDMHSWGQDVRDDIIRLEGQAGFAHGDPGDPPDGPPNDG